MNDQIKDSPFIRLVEVLNNYGNLCDLCDSYEALESLLSQSDNFSVDPVQIALLMHPLNKQLFSCVEELKSIVSDNRKENLFKKDNEQNVIKVEIC